MISPKKTCQSLKINLLTCCSSWSCCRFNSSLCVPFRPKQIKRFSPAKPFKLFAVRPIEAWSNQKISPLLPFQPIQALKSYDLYCTAVSTRRCASHLGLKQLKISLALPTFSRFYSPEPRDQMVFEFADIFDIPNSNPYSILFQPRLVYSNRQSCTIFVCGSTYMRSPILVLLVLSCQSLKLYPFGKKFAFDPVLSKFEVQSYVTKFRVWSCVARV